MINNAGLFPDHMDPITDIDVKAAMCQIGCCAMGPLLITSELYKAGKLKSGAKAVVISSQAGSAEWRKTQNKDEGGLVRRPPEPPPSLYPL